MKHIVSFSGGKDSTFLLLKMIELGYNIDEIIFCDTGMEFPAMYDHIDKVESYIGKAITRISHTSSFEYILADYVKTRGKKKGEKGYGWPDFRNRWCTKHLKTIPFQKYLKAKEEPFIEYHGIAYDERERADKNKYLGSDIRYPMIDWQVTEKQALEFCYSKGFDWSGLYEDFGRVSCWCCPLSRLSELKTLYIKYPSLWAELKRLDKKSWRRFRSDYSVEDLEKKFSAEFN
jgi:3'-phosphoadenosine 5'-phosphosulfate sulfotransferase (PAPS reductase)/FAD synthetase